MKYRLHCVSVLFSVKIQKASFAPFVAQNPPLCHLLCTRFFAPLRARPLQVTAQMFGAWVVLFAVTEIDSAAANEQCDHENQAAGINREAEISHFSATAAQIQDNEQNPSAVATAQASAFIAAATAAVAVIEHSVEHSVTSVSPIIRLSIDLRSHSELKFCKSEAVKAYFTIWKFTKMCYTASALVSR